MAFTASSTPATSNHVSKPVAGGARGAEVADLVDASDLRHRDIARYLIENEWIVRRPMNLFVKRVTGP